MRKRRIWKHVDRWIQWRHSLPRYISSIGVPLQILPLIARLLRETLKEASWSIKHPSERRWFRKHWRIHGGCVTRWDQNENGPSTVSRMDFSQLHPCPRTRNHLSNMPSLKMAPGNWRLPIWPSAQLARWWWERDGTKWFVRHSLRTRSAGHLLALLPDIQWPAPNEKWKRAESILQHQVDTAVASDACLVRDDKIHSKMWIVNVRELMHHLARTLSESDDWSEISSSVPVEQMAIHSMSRLAFPPWARGPSTHISKLVVPTMKPLVKSKCFSHGVGQTCAKPRHSCLRRVVSFAGAPHKAAWRRVASAVSFMLKDVGLSWDVFDISKAQLILKERLALLPPLRACCKCCGAPLSSTQVIVADIDQAYEQCDRLLPLQGWQWVKHHWGSADITVSKRDRKHLVRSGDFSGRGFVLSVDFVQSAITAFMGTRHCVQVGNKFFQLLGLPMGLVLSGMALSLAMVDVEHGKRRALHRKPDFQASFCDLSPSEIAGLRYVDDLLVCSNSLCGPCIKRYVGMVYPWSLSFGSISCADAQRHFHLWLDFVVAIGGQHWTMSKHSPNAPWV